MLAFKRLSLLAEGYDGVAAAIMVSPMTRLFQPFFKRRAIATLGNLAVRVGLAKNSIVGVKEHSMQFEGNNLTHDPRRHAMFQRLLEAAPNAAVHAPTYGWLDAAHAGMARLARKGGLSMVKVPVLMVTAGDDTTVDRSHAPRLAATNPLIRHREVDGALHEILMEEDRYRNRLWQEVDAFIEDVLGADTAKSRLAAT